MTRTIRLQGDSNAHDRPWRVAVEQGFFKDEGLDVEYHGGQSEGHRRSGREFFGALEGIPAPDKARSRSIRSANGARSSASSSSERARSSALDTTARTGAIMVRKDSQVKSPGGPAQCADRGHLACGHVLRGDRGDGSSRRAVRRRSSSSTPTTGSTPCSPARTKAAALMEPLVSRAARSRLPQDLRSALARRHRRRRRRRRRDGAEADAGAQPRGAMAARERGPLAGGAAARPQA